jgi:hypothetical protein
MRRFLDVSCQHLRWMLVVLVVVPCVVGAAALAAGGTSVVVALVQVDMPGFVTDVMPNHPLSQGTPGEAADALVHQLVSTTWFADRVLARVDRRDPASPRTSEQRTKDVADLQAQLTSGSRGISLLILSYTTDSPVQGVRVLDAVLGELGDALTTIEAQQASSALATANLMLRQAHDDLQSAIDDVRTYGESVAATGGQLTQDPRYRSLTSVADAREVHLQSLTRLAQQSTVVSTTIPQIPSVTVHVVDPPTAAPRSWFRGPLTLSLGALGAVALAELLLAYLVALRDPRLRSVEDVAGRFDAVSMVSLPRLGTPAP